ncbi:MULTISPECIES: hypothetical protein [Haloferax]|jgi:hypothetical protein|uniref:Uncharacterized protein n=2 Tax=Haloferax TaxID=2251 RepID=A0A6C0UMB4_HALVO|nr:MULTISPECIES: hypothetical protein [Haloferax]ELK54948.1 hypothetical protein D320_07339 [Haloferax sp. BAB-2207]MBC9984859.1 hypothetical protein [Haloferax sp. AS1]NLV01073.1 hypothetical protein [Haloferax alexandrinus]QIB76594.1 hypothetical protein G3A49_00540 [Haloferax alexandrinus]RDZ29997.1 hypothetical protein DEQ67_17400 [Haloferax sp. Atlit-48N]
MVRGFEHSVLDSSGDHRTPVLPVCDAVASSGDGERARVGAADDSANGLFSTRHSTRVHADATAN